MSTYNIHAGHSLVCRGANSILDEVTEDRKVKNAVVELLRAAGHTVYDCTDDNGKTSNENLIAIVAKCNAHAVDLDVSIHLNAGRNDTAGDGKTGGVEVWGYNDGTKDAGTRICVEIAAALGITNRGFKTNQGYYVLKHTKAQAIIIECAFVDDKDDADRWNVEKCAQAIVKGITGSVVTAFTQTANQQVSYYPRYMGDSVSIVDALQAVSVDSSFANRDKIAKHNGISNYSGTVAQNTKLLSLLKQGKLIK